LLRSLSADDDDEVEEVDALLSLKCPLSLDRIEVAAKGERCSHRRCFDLEVIRLPGLSCVPPILSALCCRCLAFLFARCDSLPASCSVALISSCADVPAVQRAVRHLAVPDLLLGPAVRCKAPCSYPIPPICCHTLNRAAVCCSPQICGLGVCSAHPILISCFFALFCCAASGNSRGQPAQ
jgi:hypothetical protein